MAGGAGTRFWPLSRESKPKQFLPLYKNKTFFEHTLSRVIPLVEPRNIYIASGASYRNRIARLIAPFKIPARNIICEPSPKNTSAAVGIASRLIHRKDPSARICFLPSDHLIARQKRFISLLRDAFRACENNLVVIGIPPQRPATGYGYIKAAGCRVEQFTEKPDLATAKRFVKDGRYFWNSGMCIGRAEKFLEEIKSHAPGLYASICTLDTAGGIPGIWKRIPSISFDYAVLEKSRGLRMLSAGDLGWSDLGSWQAFDEILEKDAQGNAFMADSLDEGSRGITVIGKGRLIATIGLNDLIIVDTPDGLLVAKKERSEEVKKIVGLIKNTRHP